MQQQQKKTKLGNGKKRNESWITATINLTEANLHSYNFNGKDYVNININIASEPNEYGKDISISLNDYKKKEDLPF